jgi:Ca-activated chloride channel family protein
MVGEDGTAVGNAIATSVSRLKGSAAKSKTVVLVTDGRSNRGAVDPVTAAKAAQALGVKIYTIGVGIRGESKIPVNDPLWGKRLVPIQEDLDEPTLLEVARVTEGNYFRATSAKELEKIYAEIDQLEKTDVDAPTPAAYQDQYLGWLIWAMMLMGSGLILQRTVWRTLP